MFELSHGVTGGRAATPAFRLFPNENVATPAFSIGLELRSPGNVDNIDFPSPSRHGELFYLDAELRASELLIVSKANHIGSPEGFSGSACFWRIGDGSAGMMRPYPHTAPQIYSSVNEAAGGLEGGVSSVQTFFEGIVAWNDLEESGGTYQIADSQTVDGVGLRGYPMWHIQADGSIINATIEFPYGCPAIAVEAHFGITPKVNGLHQFNLSRISGGKIAKVACQGQVFTLSAAEIPSEGEYALGRDVLTINGNLQERIEVTSVNTWPWPSDLYYFEFEIPVGLVIEQCRFIGQVFAAAENPLRPQAGEFVDISGRGRLILFTDTLPARNLDFSPKIKDISGQILTQID